MLSWAGVAGGSTAVEVDGWGGGVGPVPRSSVVVKRIRGSEGDGVRRGDAQREEDAEPAADPAAADGRPLPLLVLRRLAPGVAEEVGDEGCRPRLSLDREALFRGEVRVPSLLSRDREEEL